MPPTLLFYRPDEPYGYFSNFSPHPVHLDGLRWGTSEHFFQAQKAIYPQMREAIRSQSTPGKARRLAHATNCRPDWHSPDPTPEHVIELVKDRVMYRAVHAKFTQHPQLGDRLRETGDALLIEASTNDPYWGWGASRDGVNKLGKILMHLRDFVLNVAV